MKRVLTIMMLCMLVLLTGCFTPKITDTIEVDSTFMNRDISYSVTQNTLSDGNSVTIKAGYYMPEVSIICFDIDVTGHDEEFNYEVEYFFENDSGHNYHSYLGSLVSEDGETGTICHNQVENDQYTISINRIFGNGKKRVTLTTITYHDNTYSPLDALIFEIYPRSQTTVDITENPEILFDVKIQGNLSNLDGELYVRIPTGKFSYLAQKQLDLSEFIEVEDGIWRLDNISIQGLVPNERVTIAVFYSPDKDQTNIFRMRDTEDSLYSSNFDGINISCGLTFLCGKLYTYTETNTHLVLNAYLYNGVSHLNPELTDTYNIYIKVYDNEDNLLHSVDVTNNTISIPKDSIPDSGYIELESDYMIQMGKGMFASDELSPYILDQISIYSGLLENIPKADE